MATPLREGKTGFKPVIILVSHLAYDGRVGWIYTLQKIQNFCFIEKRVDFFLSAHTWFSILKCPMERKNIAII